eukprot:Em0018g370a
MADTKDVRESKRAMIDARHQYLFSSVAAKLGMVDAEVEEAMLDGDQPVYMLIVEITRQVAPFATMGNLPQLAGAQAFLGEASQVAGAATLAAETRKHIANDKRCQELGWACVPIAVETYGNWVQEAKQTFSRLASRLVTDTSQPKSLTSMEV